MSIKKVTYSKVCFHFHSYIVKVLGILAYPSYWHYKLYGGSDNPDTSRFYYSARPHPGAGIGHQLANWNAGYWWAKQFGLNFAHIPFGNLKWEKFLDFGNNEVKVSQLVSSEGYIRRRLPQFDGRNIREIQLQKDIISSYSGKKIVFIAEQDQQYYNQEDLMEDFKRKFYSSPARKNDTLVYNPNYFNIAIHVRRGDIMMDLDNPGLKKRILSNLYYFNVLSYVLHILKDVKKDIHIFFFSQGTPEDYPEFTVFKNLHWCFDMSAQQSFLHMVYANLLITSKSSFSYKPALLNNGIKACPKEFWVSYPNTSDWIFFDDNGNRCYL